MEKNKIKDFSVVYSSMTGNTKLLAETAAEHLGRDRCRYMGKPEGADLSADMLFVGFWTDRGGCSQDMAGFLEKLRDCRIFLFGTAGFGGDPEYFGRILASVMTHIDDSVETAGTYMCQGRMPMAVRERYEMMDDGDPSSPKKMLIENFDRALSHPDDDDLEGLRKAIDRLQLTTAG